MLKEKLRAQILGGALKDYKQHMSGCCKGYYVVIEPQQAQYAVKINASAEDDADNAKLNTYLMQKKDEVKEILNVKTGAHYFVLYVKMPNLAKNIPDVVNGVVEPILQYLRTNYYVSGCESCGTSQSAVESYEINGGHHYLCADCAKEVNAALEENQQNMKTKKSKFLPGLVGAFLGSLIGAVLWVVIFKLGYIAGIAGLVTGVCALKGFELLGGHVDRKGVIGSVIIMLITIFLANKIAWSWDAYTALKDYDYTFSDCFRYLGEILEANELTGSYYGDLIIGYALTFLSSFRNIIAAFKASSGTYTMKKM